MPFIKINFADYTKLGIIAQTQKKQRQCLAANKKIHPCLLAFPKLSGLNRPFSAHLENPFYSVFTLFTYLLNRAALSSL